VDIIRWPYRAKMTQIIDNEPVTVQVEWSFTPPDEVAGLAKHGSSVWIINPRTWNGIGENPWSRKMLPA